MVVEQQETFQEEAMRTVLVEAGGSGFVWTTDTASSVPSGYSVSTSYYLSNASTVSGNTEFESITGGTETGHTGNGYAKITWVSP